MKKLFLVSLFLVLLCSCGKKSPPLTLRESTPLPPSLEVKACPAGALLFIKLPSYNQAGYLMWSIKAVKIRRCLSVNCTSPHYTTLHPAIHPALPLIFYLDTNLKPDKCYFYSIKVEKNFLVSTKYTPPKKFCWASPPAPPKNFKLKRLKNQKILLSWKPPRLNLLNKPIKCTVTFYQVERLSPKKSKVFWVRKTYFVDSTSQDSCYRVRALLAVNGTLVPGMYTPLLCVNSSLKSTK